MKHTTRYAAGISSSLLAQLVPGVEVGQSRGPDLIGIHFDPDGSSFCSFPSACTSLTAYLLATDASKPSGVSGWELSLFTDPTVLPAGLPVTIANGGTSALVAPEFDVPLPAPVPRAHVIPLATIETFQGGPVSFGVGPAHPGHFPSGPGPGYSAGDDPARRTRLHVRCALNYAPAPDSYFVAMVNGCSVYGEPCITPIESASWSAVKGAYQ